MTTWICNRLTAGVICLALAGCARPFPDDSAVQTVPNSALSSATLAGGSVALVPPSGYCVDQDSLRDNFALMARCDKLGGTTNFSAPVAVLTATTVSRSLVTRIGRAFGADNETTLAQRQADGLTLLNVKGKPPSPTLRDVYWRGAIQIEDKVLGLAIYAPKNGAELGELAPELLAQALRRTKAKTADIQDNSATTGAKPRAN